MSTMMRRQMPLLCFLWLGLLAQTAYGDTSKLRIVMLIIASDTPSYYQGMQSLWRLYMNTDQKHFLVFFIKSGLPEGGPEYRIYGDTIFTTGDEGIPGLLHRTVSSIRAVEQILHGKYDYIIRTNLSSFYFLPRALKFIDALPRTGAYSGSIVFNQFASGCGFTMSRDVALFLVDFVDEHPDIVNEGKDDLVIGKIFREHLNIKIINAPRVNLESVNGFNNQWLRSVEDFTQFHWRLKLTPSYLRHKEELEHMAKLISRLYGINATDHSEFST